MSTILKSAVVCCAGVGLLLCAPSQALARPRLVESIDIQIPVSPSPVTIAGKQHLVYELHITNFRKTEVELNRLQAHDCDRGNRLADLSGAELARSIGRPGVRAAQADSTVVPAGMRAVVFMWLAIDGTTRTPNKLKHTVELELVGESGREHAVVHGGALTINHDPVIALGPPLRGGPWAALYDPKMARGHRTSIYTLEGRARIPGRFAIDWVRVEADGSRARADESRVANWYGYGAEVLAVADAVVAQAVDDMPGAEATGASQGAMALQDASGNYVVLDLGGGRYAFYEHLQHGSITVRPGDRVRRGQVIGRLGNTGSSSSGPHLHFHLADAQATLAAEGLAYVFQSFEVIGAYGGFGEFVAAERWKAAPPEQGGRRTMELPAANVVVMFE